MYFTVKELAGVAGMPSNERNVRIMLNKLATDDQKRKRENVTSKKPLEYHIDCLPKETRMALLQSAAQEEAEKAGSLDAEREISDDELWFQYDCATDAQKKRTQEAYSLCVMVRDICRGSNMTRAMNQVAEQCNTTVSRLKRYFYVAPALASKNIPFNIWLPSLLDKRGGNHLRAYIEPEAWELYKADFLRPERPTWTECYRRISLIAEREGWKLPCSDTFKARIRDEVPYEVIVLKRDGQFEAQQTLIPAQRRTREGMYAMQRVSGDGHTMRVFCKMHDGSVVRPTVWVFQDVYSSMIVGYSLDISENTEMLGVAIYNMVSKFGAPVEVDLDHGSAALSEDITGGQRRPVIGGKTLETDKLTSKAKKEYKFDRHEVSGVLEVLGAKVNWTSIVTDTNGKNKGNARAKPVERLFHPVGGIGQFERHPDFDGAYTGTGPKDKPANYGTYAVPFDEFVAAFDEWVHQYNHEPNRRAEMSKGVNSYAQTFAESIEGSSIPKPSEVQLAMCFMSTRRMVKVHSGGLVHLNAGRYSKGKTNRYHSALLYQYVGKKVTLRFNPHDLLSRVWAYDDKGRYIGEIPLYGDVAYDDRKGIQPHNLKQTEVLNRASMLASHFIPKTVGDLAEKFKEVKHDETGLGCPVPAVTEMMPSIPRRVDEFPIYEETKMAVGHDGPLIFDQDQNQDEGNAHDDYESDFNSPDFVKNLASWASRNNQ